MKKLYAVFAMALSACAVPSRESATPLDMVDANAPLLCASTAQCDSFWKRAQVWIANNSHYRIQVVSDAVVTTYGPIYSEMWLAFKATREPLDGQREQIKLATGCGNRFGCVQNVDVATARFKRFVRGEPGNHDIR